jgi:hypothetical protein
MDKLGLPESLYWCRVETSKATRNGTPAFDHSSNPLTDGELEIGRLAFGYVGITMDKQT